MGQCPACGHAHMSDMGMPDMHYHYSWACPNWELFDLGHARECRHAHHASLHTLGMPKNVGMPIAKVYTHWACPRLWACPLQKFKHIGHAHCASSKTLGMPIIQVQTHRACPTYIQNHSSPQVHSIMLMSRSLALWVTNEGTHS